MSTRAVIKVIEKLNYRKTPEIFSVYHHHDGYPDYLGRFLINELKDLGTGELHDACSVVNFLIKHKEDTEFELTQYMHVDIEYLYEIDVIMRTITCKRVHCKNWHAKNPKYTVIKHINLDEYIEKHIAELAK